MSSTGPTQTGGHNKLTGDLFDKEAGFYDRLRPSYPRQLFEVLIQETQLAPGSQLLEIGPGTGQATLPMAERGYSLTAVEPGQQLAQIASQNLASYPNVEIIVGKFENVGLPSDSFDLVYGATSMHWVDPDVLFEKVHGVLKPGGHLGIIYNELVETPKDKAFYDMFEPIIVRYGVTSILRAGMTPESSPAVGSIVKKVESLKPKFDIDHNLFDELAFFKTDPPIAFEYPKAEDYINYLRTISHVSHLTEAERENFLAEVKNMVENQFDNKVTLHFSATLHLARKKTP